MKTNKRVDLPVEEFVKQFPMIARSEISYFFKRNEDIPFCVETVLDFLLDSFRGYEEEKEIRKLIKMRKAL